MFWGVRPNQQTSVHSLLHDCAKAFVLIFLTLRKTVNGTFLLNIHRVPIMNEGIVWSKFTAPQINKFSNFVNCSLKINGQGWS